MDLWREWRDFCIFRDERGGPMVTESAAQASTEAVRPEKRNRGVERTVDLNESEIAAIEAAEMTPQPEGPDLFAAKQADD